VRLVLLGNKVKAPTVQYPSCNKGYMQDSSIPGRGKMFIFVAITIKTPALLNFIEKIVLFIAFVQTATQ
jgi:hypothetical protein